MVEFIIKIILLYPSVWDVTAAKEIAIGVDVLLEGSDGYAKEGYNFIWSTNSSGVINATSGWITDAQACLLYTSPSPRD